VAGKNKKPETRNCKWIFAIERSEHCKEKKNILS
jgi:hypothetical protein